MTMTMINTRCPHCLSMNRLPKDRLDASPTCGRCKKDLLQGAPIEGTPDNFSAIISGEQPVVVDFWAPWCTPCTNFEPIFYEESKQHEAVRFMKVDTQEYQQLSMLYNVRSIPTLLVFRQGKVIDQLNGPLPKAELKLWLAQALTK
ncbi:thioredoxin TrxC [Psychromonas sp. KJ10-10]|uniref:thioredoxin TrxC n=1 Tax=Psychromonas sp. KJ10-10 TaxID=3391823 RepID=UPI0039B6C7DA